LIVEHELNVPEVTVRPPVLILVRDLFFIAKITAVAKAVGRATRTLRDPAMLSGIDGRLVLVDLSLPGAIDAAAAWAKQHPDRAAIGFVSHVDGATALAARDAGFQRVLARSQFVEQLPELLG
jgi:DNA-binding NarL/FixJ family response regulator